MAAKSFKKLREKMEPASRKRAANQTQRLLLEMSLQELRENAAELNQEEVAAILQVTQASVSKLERRPDMHVSRLRDYIAALGGELELIAHFPDQDVRLNQFEPIEKQLRRHSA